MYKRIQMWMMMTVMSFTTTLFANSLVTLERGPVLTGTVVDSMLSMPVEYANVVLYDKETNEQVHGTVSDKTGRFELAKLDPGVYSLSITYMGFHEETVTDVIVTDDPELLDLGEIYMQRAIIMLDAVETTAEKTAFEYKLDKKVVNVDQHYTGASGTAVDVLESVPSVSVDIEGNVSLRGSGNFQVLIDGRPSILDASDALRQIPASSIENIEIITNPSAKYDPDGTSGIINIIPKKNSLDGVNGMVSLNSGVNNKYGADVILNYKTSNYNAYIGGDYNNRYSPGSSISQNQTTFNESVSFINSDGDRAFNFDSYSIRTGIDWNVSEQSVLGVGFRYGDHSFMIDATTDYLEWQDVAFDERYSYSSLSTMERGGGFGNATLNFKHDFATEGHRLVAEADYRFRNGDDVSKDELYNTVGVLQDGRLSSEYGPGQRLRAKIDYTLPLREDEKIEAGLQSRLSSSTDKTDLSVFDPTLGSYVNLLEFQNETTYDRNIHSLYGLYANEMGKLGLQGGLRMEYTGRNVESLQNGNQASINRWDYFPTAHVSYNFSDKQQMMASYTRRIERPRGYYFEPFLTWEDAYNVRQGDPAIKPEYIDSYETGIQRFLGSNMISLEGYYRITNNKIERIQSVYDENVMLQSVANVGKDYTFGAEAMLNADLRTWWNVNLMGNLSRYKIEGFLYEDAFSRSSNNWSTRLNNTFKFWDDARFQINVMYNSPTVSAQGKREGFFMTNIAVKKDFLDKKLQMIFQVRDLFSTGLYEFTSEGPTFYRYNKFVRESPQVTMTINYLINNFKNEQGSANMNGGGGEEMGF